MYNNELYHYGVKGMKWGVRRANYYGKGKSTFVASNGMRVAAPRTRGIAAYRAIAATRPVNAMLDFAVDHGNKKFKNVRSTEATRRQAHRETLAIREAQKAHKNAKKQQRRDVRELHKQQRRDIKELHKQLNSEASRKDKLMYNSATRKLAAKYVVKKGMSLEDARKKANKKAITNALLLTAPYLASSVYQYHNDRKRHREFMNTLNSIDITMRNMR